MRFALAPSLCPSIGEVAVGKGEADETWRMRANRGEEYVNTVPMQASRLHVDREGVSESSESSQVLPAAESPSEWL